MQIGRYAWEAKKIECMHFYVFKTCTHIREYFYVYTIYIYNILERIVTRY